MGPVCWGQAPKVNGVQWENCGMGASPPGTCGSKIMNQIKSVFTTATQIAGKVSDANKAKKKQEEEDAKKAKTDKPTSAPTTKAPWLASVVNWGKKTFNNAKSKARTCHQCHKKLPNSKQQYKSEFIQKYLGRYYKRGRCN